jgi:hypothetical protein
MLVIISCYNKRVRLLQIILNFQSHSSVTADNRTDEDTVYNMFQSQ